MRALRLTLAVVVVVWWLWWCVLAGTVGMRQVVAHLLHVFDVEETGSVAAKEVAACLGTLSGSSRLRKAAAVFELYDTDDSDKLS